MQARRARLSRLREDRNFAILIVPLLPALVWTGDRLQSSIAAGGPDFPVRLASVGLLIATLGYSTSWYFGSSAELNAIEAVGEDRLAYVPRPERPIVIATGLALGLLGLATIDVLLFSVILLVIKLIELAASWPLSRVVRLSLDGAEKEVNSPDLQLALVAVRRYYLDTPWAVLTAATIALASTAGLLAAYGSATADVELSVWTRTSAAVVLVIAIIVQEGRTWGWRRRYLHALEEAAAAEDRPRPRRPRRRTNAPTSDGTPHDYA
jgi:hypothetical protein